MVRNKIGYLGKDWQDALFDNVPETAEDDGSIIKVRISQEGNLVMIEEI